MSCSFCNSNSHNIRECQDPMIGFLYERIKVIYMNMMNQYPHDIEFRFKSVLNIRFNLRELRAVCATHTNFASSQPKHAIIHVLYRYYSSRIYSLPRQEGEQDWLEVSRLPTQPPEEEVYDITWYIDTTPSHSPVSLLSEIISSGSQDEVWFRLGSLGLRGPRNQDIIVARSLNADFDAVSGNIPFAPQVKKYNIHPVLVSEESEEGEEECAICYESINLMDLVKLNCEHKFCGSCIAGSLNAHNNMYCGPSCALCRKQMVSFSVKNPEIYNMVSEHCNL